MSRPNRNPPMPVQSRAELIEPELAPLLAEPFATAWAATPMAGDRAEALRGRLALRLDATRAAEAGMVTVRRRRVPRQAIAEGVTLQALYRAERPDALRPGEPLRASLVELAPGATFVGQAKAGSDMQAVQCEWLVLSGTATVDGAPMSQRDYHVVPAGLPPPSWRSDDGAVLFLRESVVPPMPGDKPFTVLDAVAGWPEFVPGIHRRVLWQRDGQAALLYWAQPGAKVPLHRHGHDEECLMLQGELFLDDLLLQTGDYQLAPAGTGHRVTETDIGVVIYAHGDLDLDFVG